MEEAIEIINYKGCTIEILRDDNYQDSPDDWGDDNVFLVHYHRDFEIKRDEIITEDDARELYQGNKIPQLKEYHIFKVDAYIHSGISLSLAGGFSGRLPQGHERFDVSSVGLVLVSKKEAKTEKQAEKLAKILIGDWNDCLSGNVYGFITKDKETGETIDSCWGFYGYYTDSGIIDEAKGCIDGYIKNNAKKERKEYWNNEIKDAKKRIKEAEGKLK